MRRLLEQLALSCVRLVFGESIDVTSHLVLVYLIYIDVTNAKRNLQAGDQELRTRRVVQISKLSADGGANGMTGLWPNLCWYQCHGGMVYSGYHLPWHMVIRSDVGAATLPFKHQTRSPEMRSISEGCRMACRAATVTSGCGRSRSSRRL